MKKHILIIASASLLLFSCATPTFAQTKIGIVDLRKVFDGYWKTKEADGSLKERAMEMDKEFKGLAEDYKKAKEDYVKLQAQATDQAVTADERDKRKKAAEAKLLEIRESEQAIESFRRQSTATLEEQKRRMREKILAEIKNVVNAKAKSAGYSLVLDAASESLNSTPTVIYTNGDNDMTDDVLKQLNALAPAGSLKSDSTNSTK